jgi:hypothetical protein
MRRRALFHSQAQIIDTKGQVIQTIPISTTTYNQQLSIHDLPTDIYFVAIIG